MIELHGISDLFLKSQECGLIMRIRALSLWVADLRIGGSSPLLHTGSTLSWVLWQPPNSVAHSTQLLHAVPVPSFGRIYGRAATEGDST